MAFVGCSNSYSDQDDLNKQESIIEQESTIKFDIGEHIISVPIESDIRFNNSQYEYHESYEVIGIATSAKGKSVNSFGGGVLLYKNIIPVKCTRGDNGYTSFGIPYEKKQVKTLK